MWMRREALLLVAPLAGCASAMAPPAAPDSSVSMCRDTGLALHIGEVATTELGAKLIAESGAHILRWVAHGQMVTMEFSADRLTVTLDEQNRIHSVLCG